MLSILQEKPQYLLDTEVIMANINIQRQSDYQLITSTINNFLAWGFPTLSDPENLLQFGVKKLTTIDFNQFLIAIDKSLAYLKLKYDLNAIKAVLFFTGIKYLVQLTEMMIVRTYEDDLLNRLNTDYDSFSQDYFLAYKYKLFEININRKFDNIINERENYVNYNLFRYKEKAIQCLKNILNDGFNMKSLFLNSLTLIHFNEFLIMIDKNCEPDSKNFELSYLQLNCMIAYYLWRVRIEVSRIVFIFYITHYFSKNLTSTFNSTKLPITYLNTA
jgi:hypothetical protein